MFSLNDVLTLCDSPEVVLLINFSETCSGNKCFICLCGVNTASTLQEYGTRVQHFPATTHVTVTFFFSFSLFSDHISGDLDPKIKQETRHKSFPCQPIYTFSHSICNCIFCWFRWIDPSAEISQTVPLNTLSFYLQFISKFCTSDFFFLLLFF